LRQEVDRKIPESPSALSKQGLDEFDIPPSSSESLPSPASERAERPAVPWKEDSRFDDSETQRSSWRAPSVQPDSRFAIRSSRTSWKRIRPEQNSHLPSPGMTQAKREGSPHM